MNSLQGKVALVTGSTSGIGLGIAHALAARGAAIMVNGFGGSEDIARVRREIEAGGVRTGYSSADLSKPTEAAALVEQTHRDLRSLDILVNNAGIQFTANVEDFPAERWDRSSPSISRPRSTR
jgi:3-hydroxybutyrate dehydrogenase